MSFPLTSIRTRRHTKAALQTGTYVVCLDCGKEFAYDWKEMRVLDSSEQRPYVHAHVEAEAS